MATQDFISKDATGKYILIEVQDGQQFPTNGIALPAGTNAVTKNLHTDEVTFWRNSLESFISGSWQINPYFMDGDYNELIWEREGGFITPTEPESPVDPIPDLGSALEFADSEFIYLLEGLTHKRLSEIQKRVVKNILNNQ